VSLVDIFGLADSMSIYAQLLKQSVQVQILNAYRLILILSAFKVLNIKVIQKIDNLLFPLKELVQKNILMFIESLSKCKKYGG